MDKQKFLNYALIAIIAILLVQTFAPKAPSDAAPAEDLQIVGTATVTTGSAVTISLKNNTAAPLTLPSDCPSEPFTVSQYINGAWQPITATAAAGRCSTEPFVIEPGARISVNYQPWQRELFAAVGRYRIEIPVGTKTFLHEIEIKAPNIIGQVWRMVFYRPIYNLLVGLTDLAGHNFGWGIVLLTILIRAILFVPFQKSLKSQRRLQKIQPQLDEIKKRYEGNQQMIAMETMALMKKNNVSMFGSCLPILIQMPFLIALYWSTRDGLGENTFVYLYSFQSNFNLATVSTNFFGLNLLGTGAQFYFALPIFLAVTQFIQMKLALHHAKKSQSDNKKKGENAMADAMQDMSKMMPYFLPAMIGFLSISLPTAVGIYWGTSTLFGIGQQIVVNRQIK